VPDVSRIDLMQEINARVNAYPYTPDLQLYRQPDFWERIGLAKAGDCEDYALEKRAQLSHAGVPLSEMRLALCFTEQDQSHALLIVTDEEGNDWILDNRQPAPYTLDELRGLGYRGDVLQVPGRQTWETWRT
jgi:predicted transglutaminase-like cysteine proteinase